ncbi:hypothetical protein [uncultured Oceanisphaera sp.]|uniref:hypothetical protein n=1 Tax=uncultured Oceanisphaera sp. TaxID=353858 RepID=UPI002606972B|nr:hypothetical protein [uncultured Oceanisphaera sp.]
MLAFLVLVPLDNVLSNTLELLHQHWMGGLVQTERHGNGLELMRGLDDILLYEEDGPRSLLTTFVQQPAGVAPG